MLLTALLAGAGYYFGTLCDGMQRAHLLLLPFSRDVLVLLLWLLLSLGLLTVAAGAVASLFRPLPLAFAAFLLCGAAMLLGWGIDVHSALLTLVLVLVGMLYACWVQAELRKRVEFSAGVVAEPQRLLLLALLVVALVSFYLGYREYLEVRGFAIPEVYLSRLEDQISERVALVIPEILRASMRGVIREQLQGVLSEQVNLAIRPMTRYMPGAVTLLLGVLLLTVTYLFSWLPVVVLWLLLFGLRLSGLVRTTTETLEVKRLAIV